MNSFVRRVSRNFNVQLNITRHMTITTQTVIPTRFEDPEGPVLGKLHSFKMFLEEGKTYKWCTCGKADTENALCDNACEGTKFSPITFTPPDGSRIYSLCLCRYTLKAPFCDGEHKKFPGWVPKKRVITP